MVAFPTVLKGVHYLCFHAGRTVRTLTRQSGTLDLLNHQQSNNNNNNNVDSYTCVKGLMKCIATKDLALGREVHNGIIRNNLHLNIYVVNTLIRMYALCGELADARQIFNEMVKRDIVSWNTMVGGYAQRGHAREAFALFCQMQQEGLKPNRITYLSILPACASPATLKWGKEVHAHIVSAGYQSDVRVETALLKMYAKCGSMKDAREIFDRMATTTRDVVSWTVLIGGYAKSGLGDEAFKLFDQMQQERVVPNRITYLSVLNACANPSNLEWGKKIHSHALGAGFVSDGSVGNALVNMYAKCGSMEDARRVFDGMVKRDVVSWTAMIGGYAESGQSEKAFQMFQEMQQHGLQPNRITYMTVLNACTSSGALDWVKEIHTHIVESGLTSDTSVNNALVNMYAKCGSIEDARVVFDEMGSKRDIISWNAMIGGYALHGRGQDALRDFCECSFSL
jgi:pentatricopeptide repeat protein